MSQTIKLFMWQYQSAFRLFLERRAREVFQRLVPQIEPLALFVGVRTPESVDPNPVCVEPEDGRWDPAIFGDCERLTKEIFDHLSNQSPIFSDAASMRDRPENLRRDSVQQAVENTLASHCSAYTTISFVGTAQRVGEFHVVPVLQLPSEEISPLPSLPNANRNDRSTGPLSLFDAVARRLLDEASQALTGREPGRHLDAFALDDDALLRDAGKHFCDNLTLVTGDEMPHGLFEALNVIASLPYEGASNSGRLLFAPRGADCVDFAVNFAVPVTITEARLARKLLETSSDELQCIFSSRDGIIGLSALAVGREAEAFLVRFGGRSRWEIVHANRVLMVSNLGVPSLPREKLAREDFEAWIVRVFSGLAPDEGERLSEIVDEAARQAHGTMIVVSEDAKGEAVRLSTQGLPIEPVRLTRKVVARISCIDGAVLFDTKGCCHAIGVILDGLATPAGDPSRGARYNSAIRYISSAKNKTACLVVSEDGYVDLVPRLKPQIRASIIREKLDRLAGDNIYNRHEAISWLSDHRFYLDEQQCAQVNGYLRRIKSAPYAGSEVRVRYPELEVDPGFSKEHIVDDLAPAG